MLIGSRLHSSQIATYRVSGEVCLNDARAPSAVHGVDQGNNLDNIFRINNLNSALHLTQTYCILPERAAAATHRHLDYFWYCF